MRASKAGFCMGVSLALKKLQAAISKQPTLVKPPRRICTMGPIIHNPRVLAHFEDCGVVCLNNVSEALPGDYALIRAHGITRQEENELKKRCGFVEDATCPKVKKAQLAIASSTRDGATLLLFGEADHPEVRGLMSYASGDARVFSSLEEMLSFPLSSDFPYILASQTTQDRDAFAKIAAFLTKLLPNLKILSTICDATRQRQEEALGIAGKVDIMVVAGGKSSGNTRRLAALALQAGIKTLHVESVADLNPQDFQESRIAGLTAGASTPVETIDEIEHWLASL